MKRTIVLFSFLLLLSLSIGAVSAQDEPVTLRLWAHQEANFNTARRH